MGEMSSQKGNAFMKALVVRQFGSPPGMAVEARPLPGARDGMSVVSVKTATINQLSGMVRAGQVPAAKPPLVLGNEGAGIVESSRRFAPGTRVVVYGAGQLGITEDGLHQQSIVVEDKRLFALPEALDLDEGAAIAVNYITAYQALTRVADLRAGQTVLVSGATGCLGHALMQTARALGTRPVAIVSSTEKARRAAQAGAQVVIDLSRDPLRDTVLDITNGAGAELAADAVGGAMLGRLAQSVRRRGSVVAIGLAGGLEASVDLVDLVVHEKKLLGYDLHLETDEDVARAWARIAGFVSAGLLRPVIDSTFSLDTFEAGYQRLASRQAVGAIVLRL